MNRVIRENINEYANPTEKDFDRMRSLFTRSKGDYEKMIQLASNMADSITSKDKAESRALAALHVFGQGDNEVADIFNKRAEELSSESETVDQGTPINKPVEKKKAYTLPANPGFSQKDIAEINKKIFDGKPFYKGFIYLPTYSAIAVWEWEITGQLSDGAWENARPHDHWEYWSHLYPKLGRPENASLEYPRKTSYRLNDPELLSIVGDRMANFGRFGKAIQMNVKEADYLGSSVDSIIEDLPREKPEDWKDYKKQEINKYPHRDKDYYWKGLTEEVIEEYYNTTYLMKDLRKDLKLMKEAMKNVR